MHYLKWLILAVGGIFVTLTNVILSPVIPLFIHDSGFLPACLSWFQTPDNPAIGDASFQTNQMYWTKSRYLYGLFWALRNPGYGYDAYFGARVLAGFEYATNNLQGVDIQNGVLYEGTVKQTLVSGSDEYFEWCVVKKLNSKHYFRASFGWHLNPPFAVGQVRNLTFSISPWMKIE